MAYIKGIGVPTIDIVASIGDIYTDEQTSISYKCTYAGYLGDSNQIECEWEKIKHKTFNNNRNLQKRTVVKGGIS